MTFFVDPLTIGSRLGMSEPIVLKNLDKECLINKCGDVDKFVKISLSKPESLLQK